MFPSITDQALIQKIARHLGGKRHALAIRTGAGFWVMALDAEVIITITGGDHTQH